MPAPWDHIKLVQIVLRLLCRNVITLRLKKSNFFAENIAYLSHVIRPHYFEVVQNSTEAVEKLKRLTTQTELYSVIDL